MAATIGFRHTVLLTLKPETTQQQKDAILEGLGALPAQISQILSYSFGVDAGLKPENATIAIVADFADIESYQVYAAHEAHIKLIAEKISPHLESRKAVQYTKLESQTFCR